MRHTPTTISIPLLSRAGGMCEVIHTDARCHLSTLSVTCSSSCSIRVQLDFIVTMMDTGAATVTALLNHRRCHSERGTQFLSLPCLFVFPPRYHNPVSNSINITEVNSFPALCNVTALFNGASPLAQCAVCSTVCAVLLQRTRSRRTTQAGQ